MVYYIKQYDEYSCGPIALFNVLRWCGIKITRKNDFQRLKQLCKCDFLGTNFQDFSDCLNKEIGDISNIIEYDETFKLTISFLKAMIRNKYSIVLGYGFFDKKEMYGHYIFISEYSKGMFLVHNENNASEWISTYKIKKMIEFEGTERNGTKYPHTWFIQRKELN